MFLSNVIPPFEDELLYSYILRLAKVNGFDGKNDLSLFLKYYVNDQKGLRNPNIKYYSEDALDGLVKYLNPILNHDGSETDFLSFYLDHTVTAFFQSHIVSWSPLRPLEYQFARSPIISTSYKYAFRNRPALYFCPECMAADRLRYGTHYIHRTHQYFYSQICPVHRCGMMIYKGFPGEELKEVIPLIKTPVIENEYSADYTEMCTALYDYNHDLDKKFDYEMTYGPKAKLSFNGVWQFVKGLKRRWHISNDTPKDKENACLLTSSNSILYLFYSYLNLGKDLSVIMTEDKVSRKYLLNAIQKAAGE